MKSVLFVIQYYRVYWLSYFVSRFLGTIWWWVRELYNAPARDYKRWKYYVDRDNKGELPDKVTYHAPQWFIDIYGKKNPL